jgi:DNA-binding NtrC family response regulator
MANILVVDDEMGIRELLSEILEDEGHVVTLAENAAQAREARATSAPNLILLDIWMPDMDGVTLLKEWQRDALLTMPVVVMSGHATIDNALQATRIGAFSVLEKPIALQKLLKTVQEGLAHRQAIVRAISPTPVVVPNPVIKKPQVQIPMPPQQGITARPVPACVSVVCGGDMQAYRSLFNLPLREARLDFERMYFQYHLSQAEGSMTQVAEKTGMERTHLYRKLKQLGVEIAKRSLRVQ